MFAQRRRLLRAIGAEWWFLLALVPLVRRGPAVSFIHDLFIAALLIALITVVILRSRIGDRRLSAMAYVSLLPVVALGILQAGRRWGALLVILWAAVLVWHLLRGRPVLRPARGPLMWLFLVSVTWALLFLVVADSFLRGPTPTGWWADRLLAFLTVVGLIIAIAAGGLLWWNRRDSPASATVAALVGLSVLVVSEGRHDVRLWRGARELRRLEQEGDFVEARELLNELWGLSRAKGQRFVHPDLTLSSARLDIRDEHPDRAVECLLWLADHAPQKQPEVCRLLDETLVNQLLQMPEHMRDVYALFSDAEYAADEALFLLDRWGRVFQTVPDSNTLRLVHPEPLPVGRAAVDFEPVGEADGFLLLDDAGEIHLRGKVPAVFRELLASGLRPVSEAVDLELSLTGEGLYVVNAYGALAAYGNTAFVPQDNPHKWNYRIIRDLEVCPGETGLVLLDGYGSLHAVGEIPFDPKQPGAPYWFEVLAEDIEFWPAGDGMYLMNCRGEWARFGHAPLDPASPSFPHIGGVDFEINPSGDEIALLRRSGAIRRFRFGEDRLGDLLAEAKAAKEIGDLRVVWEKAREAALLGPETIPTLHSLFDAEYYQALLKVPEGGEQPFPLLRRLARLGERSYILDAWGQILFRDGPRVRFYPDPPPLPPGHFAVDFSWIGQPPLPVILTDKGVLCYSNRLPDRLRRLLEQCPENIRDAVRLQVNEEAERGYVLDGFGRIHPFGASPVGTPAEWQPRWDTAMAIDFAPVSEGRGIVILDRFGGLHKVGLVDIDTTAPGAPWWGSPVACALAADQAGDSIAVLNVFGDIVPLGPWQQDFHRGISPVEEAPYAVDLEFCPDDGFFRVLAWTGRERAVPIGERTAERLADEGLRSFRQGDLPSAVYKMTQAAHAAPERAAEILATFDASWLEAVAAGAYHTAAAPDIVSAGLPGEEPGSLFVLDRFGRIWRWELGRYQLHLPQTILLDPPGERQAVAFRRRGDGFAVLDSLGGITLYEREQASPLLEEMEFPSPAQHPVDFTAWGEGFLILDSLGGITPVGLEESELPTFPEVSWGFPIARRLHHIEDRVYVLDGLGGIHAPLGEGRERIEGAPYFSEDLVRDFEPDSAGGGFFVMDFAGRLFQSQRARPLLNDALLPREVVSLNEIITGFEKDQRGVWRERNLGERKFVKSDYVDYDSAIDLVHDPRDGALYVLYRNGRVAPIWTQKSQATHYAALAQLHRTQGDIRGSIAELTRALVLDQDPSLLESLDEASFSDLSRTEEPFLRFFRDLELSDRAGAAFVLDRWGRIFEWSYGPHWTPVFPLPFPQGESGKGEAVALARVGGDGFVVLTRAGELVPRGSVPPSVEALLASWKGEAKDAVDLAFSRTGELAVIGTAHGEVWRISGGEAELWPGNRIYWEDEVGRALAMRAGGTGCVLYDFFGGIHACGEMPSSLAASAPYVDRAIMADLWITDQGDQAAFLRMDGTVLFSDGSEHPPWHPRFLPPVLSEFRPSVPRIWEAISNDISPAVDLEVTPDLTGLFALRGNGEVIRVWRGEQGAREEVVQGLEAFRAGDVSAAVVHLDRAAFLHPQVLVSEEVMAVDVAARVYDSGVRSASPVPFFVDVSMLDGSPLVLDRWGGLHRPAGEAFERVRASGRTARSGACAVGMATAAGRTWIAYENGEVEGWGSASAGGSLSFPIDWPAEMLVDIAGDPEGAHLFGCTSGGEVIRLDPSTGSQEAVYSAGWSFPLAVTYVPENAQGGYLLDRFGSVHRAERASIFTRFARGSPAPYWQPGWARDLCLTPGGSALVLLDAFAGIHFLGTLGEAVSVKGLPYFDAPVAVRVLVHGNRILVLDASGRLHASEPLPPGI